jgi:RHS repeat-associated protein
MNTDARKVSDQVRSGCRGLWRAVLALNVAALLGTFVADGAWAANHAPNVNRTVPNVSSPAVLSFSSPPTNAEFLRTGLFAEPLAPVAATTPAENRDLARSVLAYRDAVQRMIANDAVGPLLEFLAAHPASPWKPALQLNLGMIYRQTGHFSKALDVWQAGWSDAKVLSDPQGRALADAMVARLSQLEAYLGRKELLAPLLDSIQSRAVGGTAAQLITDSHTGLYDMVYHPDESFRCGPLALTRILKYGSVNPSPVALQVLDEAPSTSNGLSLSAVQQIGARAGMNYQMAYRTAGAPVILPAVAHWKVGHYAAVVDYAKGLYVVEDTTFGEDIRISPITLDEEASGYFLVPAGPLPFGWRRVSESEGGTVWGRGDTGTNHDTGATGAAAKNCKDSGGCTTSSVEMEVVGLQLHDAPVGYKPPLGPAVNFELFYSHRDTQQPATFSYSNFGRKWTFTWLSYITDSVSSNAQALLYLRGGGNEPYTFSSTSATTAYPGPFSHSILTRTVNGSGNSTGFTLTLPDGSFEQFQQAFGNQFFMTAVSDPAGNITTLTYDSQMRIVAITDAIGQVTTLSYALSSSPLVVTKITDPFGRFASFTYNANGQLASITDVLGITSSYSYGQGTDPDFINTLTTPYGSTTFTYGDLTTNPNLGSTRSLTTVDPLNRTSYVEFNQNVYPADRYSSVPSGMYACTAFLNARNTFIFDANQYSLAMQGGALNYNLAHLIHWMHTSDGGNTSRFKESEKQPLENRVWYNYPAQAACFYSTVSSSGVVTNGASDQPSVIARLLDDGTTQLQTFQYNSSGKVTQATDGVGRKWTYTYAANGIDRLTTSNTTNGTQLLETRTYNSQHLPLTITGGNGMTAKYKYNADGKLTRYTDQQGYATSMTYDGDGRLKSTTGAISTAKYTFAYDTVSRIASVSDPAGTMVHFTYDAADRPVGATYPDGTNSKLAYTLLDLSTSTDRLHQTTRYSYDADRELIAISDPLGHTVQQGYNLAGRLSSITDANNHTTTLALDDESRMTAKQFANGTSVNVVYESGLSRVATVTDAMGQTTTFTYNADNTTATISYSANQPTLDVSFAYDPAYPRPISMTDGIGTTTYSYYPVSLNPTLGANQLHSINSPIAGTSGTDTVSYSYDALNRIVGYSINGVAQSRGFDALGRITSASNPLDSFTYSYSDGTSRVTGVSSNSGPSAAMTYFGPTGHELLQQMNITTHSGGTSLAQFGYTYSADDYVKSVTVSSPSAQTTSFGYDAANRLLSGLFSGTTPQYAYSYDRASNLTSITPNGPQQTFSYTSTNSITSGNYDANGSPTALSGKSYKWDGANRIVHFANTANNTGSSFTYDGLGRLVRVVDTHAGAITADHSYTWCGSVRCLAHDNTQSGSPVSSQYFDQGEIIGGTRYYYVKDELGSVTELVSSTGIVTSQYAYDPYGNRTTLSGTVVPDIGYAGYFYHAASGLDFAMYRAYDPTHARWLNRDPAGEMGGVNLYAYVSENPIATSDPFGLWSTQAHNAIISAAFPGLSANLLHAIQDGSASVDELIYQLIGDPAEHAMSRPGEDPSAARGRACSFIADHLARYRQMATSSEPSVQYMAYFELGEAMHTVMDSTSPAHAGFLPWSILHPGGHGDLPGSIEDLAHLTPQLLQETVDKMNAIMSTQNCGCTL